MNSCRCPYCGKRISYFTALSIRRRGEYYCKKCKKESNVHIKKTIWVLFFAALVFALIILGYYLLITDRENPWFVFFVAVPFLLFYLFSPLFVRLRPKKKFQDSLYDTDICLLSFRLYDKRIFELVWICRGGNTLGIHCICSSFVV